MTTSKKLYRELAKAIGAGIVYKNVVSCICQVLKNDNPTFKEDTFRSAITSAMHEAMWERPVGMDVTHIERW